MEDLHLAAIGAKKIKSSDPRWVVHYHILSTGNIEITGFLFELQEVDSRPRDGFQILIYENGTVSSRRYRGNYTPFNFRSMYDAVDWIISGTSYPPDYISPEEELIEKKEPFQIKVNPIGK